MVVFRSTEEGQAILKVDRGLRAIFLHNLTATFFLSTLRLKMKLEGFSEKSLSAIEIKLCQNTKDHNMSL